MIEFVKKFWNFTVSHLILFSLNSELKSVGSGLAGSIIVVILLKINSSNENRKRK